jgi:hypothetical protein
MINKNQYKEALETIRLYQEQIDREFDKKYNLRVLKAGDKLKLLGYSLFYKTKKAV